MDKGQADEVAFGNDHHIDFDRSVTPPRVAMLNEAGSSALEAERRAIDSFVL